MRNALLIAQNFSAWKPPEHCLISRHLSPQLLSNNKHNMKIIILFRAGTITNWLT